VNAANGLVLANYEYGPFGEVIRATGPMAKLNPFLFSAKYQDDETDLVYYGYRFYNATTGRWLSRDPIRDMGFYELSKASLLSRAALYDEEDIADAAVPALLYGYVNTDQATFDWDSKGKVRIKGDANTYGFVQNDSLDWIDVWGLGTWSYPVSYNGTLNVQFDAFYTLDSSELCKCKSAVVDRYVRKVLGIWPGTKGNYYDDNTKGLGGYWVPPDQAHAEGDGPDGPNRFGYHSAWAFAFKFVARCTSGPAAGDTLSTDYNTYKTTGHVDGHGWYGSFSY
jgi:RHS repeat-associated protein